MQMKEQKVITVLKDLAVRAGFLIMDIYETDFSVDYKEDASPLTLADRRANTLIVNGLQAYFPECAILSEEMRDDASRREQDYCFIVDPLDGTKEFVKRNGQFTVNIALVYKQHPVVGVIYVPVTGELFYAGRESGAWKVILSDEICDSGFVSEALEGLKAVPLRVSDKEQNLIWVGSKSHSTEKEKKLIDVHASQIAEVVAAGSSLKGCLVAEAKADVYYRFGLTCEWDTAAMHCIAEAAGAVVRQMDNTELLYNRENILNEKGFYIVNRIENVWM